MGVALSSLMIMAVAGRELSNELTTFQILFFRSTIGLVVLAVVLQRIGWAAIRTKKLKLHIGRNISHYIGQFGWFYGIAYLPLAQVFAIEFTVPIWTALLAPMVLGESLTRIRATAVAIGFVGILIVLRPGLVPVDVPTFAVLIAAFGFAGSILMTKRLTRTDSALAMIFYMTLLQLPMGLVPSLFQWTTPSPAMWPWLVVVGVGALSAHYSMARAFALADAVVVAPMDFLRLPLAVVVGLMLYNDPVDLWVVLGAAVIFAGNFLNIVSERRPV
ncbi:MAG: DMT family transporter [Proteobacteria bacterium]|nr:DMT family transporter [Pseudomonadota bacterium]